MNARREIIVFESDMTMTDYLQEIGAFAYVDEQYFHIAVSDARLKHIAELRKFLLINMRLIQIRQFYAAKAIQELNDLSSQHTEDINDLLDLFSIANKSTYIEEHETSKAHTYCMKMIDGSNANNLSVLNDLFNKLKIEECVLTESVAPYKNKFINFEDVYDRPC